MLEFFLGNESEQETLFIERRNDEKVIFPQREKGGIDLSDNGEEGIIDLSIFAMEEGDTEDMGLIGLGIDRPTERPP